MAPPSKRRRILLSILQRRKRKQRDFHYAQIGKIVWQKEREAIHLPYCFFLERSKVIRDSLALKFVEVKHDVMEVLLEYFIGLTNLQRASVLKFHQLSPLLPPFPFFPSSSHERFKSFWLRGIIEHFASFGNFNLVLVFFCCALVRIYPPMESSLKNCTDGSHWQSGYHYLKLFFQFSSFSLKDR